MQAGTPARERGKAPMPREHSGEVYRGLRGTDATELAALVASGIISCASVFPEPQAREEVERLLLDRHSLLHQWCDPSKIKRLIEQNRKGVIAAEHHVYKLVTTQLWLRECVRTG